MGVEGSSKRFRIREGLVTRTVDGEKIIVPIADSPDGLSHIYALRRGVEIDIWGLVDKRRTVVKIVDSLLRKYDAPKSRVEADVDNFLRDLKAENLIVEC